MPIGIALLLLLFALVVLARQVFLIVHRSGVSALSLPNIIANEPYLLLWPVLLIGCAIYAYFSNKNG